MHLNPNTAHHNSAARVPALLLGATLLWLAAVPAQAQPQPSLDGRWSATFATDSSEARHADVLIHDGQGSWTTQPRAKDKRDPCVGRAMPLTVSAGPASTLLLRVEAASTLQGCKDRRARLTIVDAQTLEGEFDNGRVLRLVRSTAP